jgi:hypothetical protein
MELVGNYQNFVGSGRRVRGDYNKVTGAGCTVIGNYNNVTGNSCTIYGNYNKIVGNNGRAVGDGNKLVGVGCSATGNYNKFNGKDKDKDKDVGGKKGGYFIGGMSMSNGRISFHGRREVGEVIEVSDCVRVQGPDGEVVCFDSYVDAHGMTYNSRSRGRGEGNATMFSRLAPSSSSSSSSSSSTSSSSASSTTTTTTTTTTVTATAPEAHVPGMQGPVVISGNSVVCGCVVNNGTFTYSAPRAKAEDNKQEEKKKEEEKTEYYDTKLKETGDVKADDKAALDVVCVVCNENMKKVALVPCGHRCLCVKCGIELADRAEKEAKKLECPICRGHAKCLTLVYD